MAANVTGNTEIDQCHRQTVLHKGNLIFLVLLIMTLLFCQNYFVLETKLLQFVVMGMWKGEMKGGVRKTWMGGNYELWKM